MSKLSKTYGVRPDKKSFIAGGLESVPQGAHLVTKEVKEKYESIPFHVFHPNPHDAITILRSKKNSHDWLVCGWYLDTLREGGKVRGLVYRQVTADADKEAVILELKRHDKEGIPRFDL
jgi:hypothetical protein